MSFLKKLFGGRPGGGPEDGRVLAEEDYKGYRIRATEKVENGEYLLSGEIEKAVDGETRVQRFIRADRVASVEQVVPITLSKARRIIDEQGDALFRAD